MELAFTYVHILWLLYATACVALVAFFFQAPRVTLGSAGLAALLIQQALGTVCAVIIFAATTPALASQAFHNGAVIWLLWGPLVAIAPVLLLGASADRRLAWVAAGLGALPTAAFLGVAAFRPGLLIEDGVALSPTATFLLYSTFASFAATTWLLMREALKTPAPLRRAQFALLAAAFGLEGAFHAGQHAGNLALGQDLLRAWSTSAPVALAAVGFLAVALWSARASFAARLPEQRRWARILLGCLVVASVTGSFTARLLAGEEFRDPRGLFHAGWDLVALSLLVFAGFRFQLFDIEIRARQGIIIASVVVLGFVGFTAAENFIENFLQDRFFGGLPAAGTIAGVFVAATSAFTMKIGKHVANRLLPDVAKTVDYEARRRDEIYLAALEGALLDGAVSLAEANSIKRLREALAITDAEHARLEARVVGELRRPQASAMPLAA